MDADNTPASSDAQHAPATLTAPAFGEPPAFGNPLPAALPNRQTIELLLTRRSTTANQMQPPGPNADQLEMILRAGARVPDHGKLAPWRFILITDENRSRLGALLADRAAELNPSLSDAEKELERTRFERAPLVITVISSPHENHKIPLWEQELSAGAVCQNMLIAANAMGFASQWLSEWCAYDRTAKRLLGLNPGERIAGFIYIGSTDQPVMERKRPELQDLVTTWKPSA